MTCLLVTASLTGGAARRLLGGACVVCRHSRLSGFPASLTARPLSCRSFTAGRSLGVGRLLASSPFTARPFSTGRTPTAARSKLAFEVDVKVARDTLLYEHTNARFFRLLSVFGLAQLVFWGQLAVFSYTSLDAIDSAGDHSASGHLEGDHSAGIRKDSFWGKIVMLQTQYKKRISGLCVGIGTLALFFTVLYPRRTISRLVLLRGGQDLRVNTYTHFGKTREFCAPVAHLSVQAARASKASQVSLKLKGHRFFYLMDKRDGVFHNTKLFDYAIGIKRSI